MNRDNLLNDLKRIFKKHGVWPSGSLKLREFKNGWDGKTADCIVADENGAFPYKDTDGPFINFSIIPVEIAPSFVAKKVNTVLMDKDALLANGIKSPLTQESFTNRKAWAEHLKANGCVEIGNDFNNAKMRTEVRGDFDCRKELSQATHQVMDKYGH